MAIEWQEHFMILVMGHGLPYYILLFFAGRCPRKCLKGFHVSMMRRPLSRLSNLHHRQVFAKASKALPYGVRDFNLLTSLQSTIVPVSGLNLFCYKIVYCSEYPSAMCLLTKINWEICVFNCHHSHLIGRRYQISWIDCHVTGKPWREQLFQNFEIFLIFGRFCDFLFFSSSIFRRTFLLGRLPIVGLSGEDISYSFCHNIFPCVKDNTF